MIGIKLEFDPNTSLRILCLGAHSDDIEIGCGGTILRLIEKYDNLEFWWVVLGADHEQRSIEAQESANTFLHQVNEKKIIIKGFRDSFFPYIGAEIKGYFNKLQQEISPDMIFTHYRHDLHQDHRLISELTWNTFRNHLILEYEIPKYDGDMGIPNVFVPLGKDLCQKKIRKLLNVFQTQKGKHWFTEDAFWSILRLRGIESNAPEKFAEAFYCRKLAFLP